MITTCTFDSGSATGCRPLCSDPGTHAARYLDGPARGLSVILCAGHVRPHENRSYPSAVEVTPVTLAGSVTYAHGSGAYVCRLRGGTVSGTAATWETVRTDLERRHGYVVARVTTESLPSAGEVCTTATLWELDWSRCPA